MDTAKARKCLELIRKVKLRAPEAFTADDIFIYASNERDMYNDFGGADGGLCVDSPNCLFDTLEEMIGNDYDAVESWDDLYDDAIERHRGDKKDLVKEERKLGLFDTPYPIALAMADMGDLRNGDHIFDPSAGRGRLLEYARLVTHERRTITTEGIELVGRQEISKTGDRSVVFRDDLGIRQGNFMEMTPLQAPDVVLMNPPFGSANKDLGEGAGERALVHFYRAFSQLKQGGRIVALLPTGPFNNNKNQSAEFRQRLAAREVVIQVHLEGGLFKETPIPTKIVVVDKVPQTGRARYGAFPVAQVNDVREIYSAVSLCCKRRASKDK